MIAAYQGKVRLFRDRAPRRQPLCAAGANRCAASGGVTARLGRARSAAMPFKGTSYTLRYGGG